ncbi:hypothetical protein MMC09_002531 [Bachmanniomyces sp. S44760]|nr:hypothetical protein [Bachmanniomyces sp. S44760]
MVRWPAQTSKQAKKAYRVGGATRRLSEVEQRRLRRAEELQARAARTKEREQQKRINKQKKLDKDEREREAKRRKGMVEPVDDTGLSPRQTRMDVFFNGRQEDIENDAVGWRQEELPKLLDTKEVPVEHALTPTRNPLQPICANRSQETRKSRGNEWFPRSSPPQPQEDDWLSILASGTQIERELSSEEPQEINPHLTPPDLQSEILECAAQYLSQFDDVLACLSSQDRQFIQDMNIPSLSTQDHDSTIEDRKTLSNEKIAKLSNPNDPCRDFTIVTGVQGPSISDSFGLEEYGYCTQDFVELGA